MSKRIVVVGSGFADFSSALGARRLASLSLEKAISGADKIEVVVIAPDVNLVIRPRLYEPDPEKMSAPVDGVYRACGVRFVYSIADIIRTANHEIEMVNRAVQDFNDYAFSVDQIEDAVKLDRHLRSLALKPASKARDTLVVYGGGFTRIKIATELPSRLRTILGEKADIRVIIVGRQQVIGAGLGPKPRLYIIKALNNLGIESLPGTCVTGMDAGRVTLSSGEHIETLTTIWTAGVQASSLTTQVPGEKDAFGRLHVDRDLRISSGKDIFATGDVACALADGDGGHYARMSCQHASPLGKIAGHNAMADLLKVPAIPYSQPIYAICLDLGATGAFFGGGWETDTMYAGPEVKSVKQTSRMGICINY